MTNLETNCSKIKNVVLESTTFKPLTKGLQFYETKFLLRKAESFGQSFNLKWLKICKN